MVVTRLTIQDFAKIKEMVEDILPDNEVGMEIQMRMDSFLEELTAIHQSILDNQRNQYNRRRVMSR